MKKIYRNGTIITMTSQEVNAVVIENGRIIGFDEVEDAEVIDLHGCTLMPAFIDAHSHITALTRVLGYVDLGQADSIEMIQSFITKYKQEHQISDDEWIFGYNYDHNNLKEKRHPNGHDLDMIMINNPILITHTSGHMGVVNSLGLSLLGIRPKTADPIGGRFGRDAKGRVNGYMEENAFISNTAKCPEPAFDQLLKQLKEAQKIYLKNGITVVQEGIAREKEWRLLKKAAELKELIVDVIAYVDEKQSHHILMDDRKFFDHSLNRLKLGGYKLFLDGSPQGRTAWMLEPYLGSKDYCGYPTYQDEEVVKFVKKSCDEGVQLLVHCNGDAAAQQLLDAFHTVLKGKASQLRPVMIHAQLINQRQLKIMHELKMIASFFIAHTYYWGDIHLKNFGEEQASLISPAHSAILEDVIYTFHQDTPVIQPNMLETIGCAVNRRTKSGRILGADECICVEDALKGVTINAAYQYFQEHERGTIELGKLADFVILSDDPRTVDKLKIREIEVLATIKEGQCCYRKNTFEK